MYDAHRFVECFVFSIMSSIISLFLPKIRLGFSHGPDQLDLVTCGMSEGQAARASCQAAKVDLDSEALVHSPSIPTRSPQTESRAVISSRADARCCQERP